MRMTCPQRIDPVKLLGLLPLLIITPSFAAEVSSSPHSNPEANATGVQRHSSSATELQAPASAGVRINTSDRTATRRPSSATSSSRKSAAPSAPTEAGLTAQALPAAAGEPELRPIDTQVGATLTTGGGAGYESSYGSLDAFIPLSQTVGRNLTFLQSRVLVDAAEGNVGGNLLLGYRHFNPKTTNVIGGYLGFDIRDTGYNTVSQLGAGFEVIAPKAEFRVNGYLPLGDREREISSTTTQIGGQAASSPFFQGNSLVTKTATQILRTDRLLENSLGGFDAEVGAQLLRWNLDSSLYGYLGTYYYGGYKVSDIFGARGRLEARLSQNLQAGVSVQSDREFGTTVTANLSVRFGRKPSSSTGVATPLTDGWAHMGDWITRQNAIAVTQRSSTNVETVGGETLPLLNPATGQPWFFTHVNLGVGRSNGTFEDPYGTVAEAVKTVPQDGNGIIYVQAGTNPGIPSFTVPKNVQALSTGVEQSLPTVQRGVVVLPLSRTGGTLPTVLGTVTMSDNTTLSGFDIIPPTSSTGVIAKDVQNVIVRQNKVSVSGDDTPGIRLENVTGTATVTGNQVNTSGNSTNTIFTKNADGIQLVQDNTRLDRLVVTNNVVTTAGRDAFGIWVIATGSQIGTIGISDNTVTTNGPNSVGIIVQTQPNSLISNLTVSNNLLQPSTGDKIRIDNWGDRPFCAAIKGNRFAAGGGLIRLDSGIRFLPSVQPFKVVGLSNLSLDNPGATLLYDTFLNVANSPTAGFANTASCP